MISGKWIAGLSGVIMLVSVSVSVFAAREETSLPVAAGEVLVESMSGDNYENSGYFPKGDKVRVIWRRFKPFITEAGPDPDGKNRYASICKLMIRTSPEPGYVVYSNVLSMQEITGDEVVFENITIGDLDSRPYVTSFTNQEVEQGAGNKFQQIAYRIDYAKPEILNLTAGYHGNGDGAFSYAVLHMEARDTNSGLSSEAYSMDGGVTWQSSPDFTVTRNDTYRIYVRDKTHQTNFQEITVEGLDGDGPCINEIKKHEIDGKNGYAREIRIEVNAQDEGSGLAREAYSFDGGITFTDQNQMTVSQNGTVKIVVKDSAGNCTEQEIVVSEIDRTGPSLQNAAVMPVDGWNGYGKQADVSFSLADTEAGLADEPISYDEGQTFTGDMSKRYTENGSYKIFMKDALGNSSEALFDIDCIDRDAPHVEIRQQMDSVSINGFCREAELHIQAYDAGAGLAPKPYSFDRGITWTDKPDRKVSENKKVDIWVRDALMNVTEKSIAITGLDSDGPIVSKIDREILNQSGKFGTGLTLTVHAEDKGAGLAKQPFSFDGGKNYTDSAVWNGKENGVISLVVRDGLLNETRRDIKISEIDTTAPSGDISGNPKETVKKNVTLTFTGRDSESGIAALWYQSDRVKIRHLLGRYDGDKTVKKKVTITANGKYRFIVQDMVGNTAEYTVNVTKIRKNRPGEDSDSGSESGGTGNQDSGPGSSPGEASDGTILIGDSGPSDEESPSSGNHVVYPTEKIDFGENGDGVSSNRVKKGGKTKVVKLSGNQVDDGEEENSQNADGRNEEKKRRDSKETIESLLKETMSDTQEIAVETGESSYPEIVEDKGIGMKKIVAATLGLILLLCAAAFGILWYRGIIVFGSKEDEEDEAKEES